MATSRILGLQMEDLKHQLADAQQVLQQNSAAADVPHASETEALDVPAISSMVLDLQYKIKQQDDKISQVTNQASYCYNAINHPENKERHVAVPHSLIVVVLKAVTFLMCREMICWPCYSPGRLLQASIQL